jgi:hypothetical protein
MATEIPQPITNPLANSRNLSGLDAFELIKLYEAVQLLQLTTNQLIQHQIEYEAENL